MDDSNSVITFEDPNKINFYLDRYFWIMMRYYKLMKLKLNSEKTIILTVSRKARIIETADVKIVDGNETII